ncbi:MAG: four helix bundle protein [Planctomycetota bacterium]
MSVGQNSGFKGLIAWPRAMELACETYKLTAAFPSAERFGLTAQVRRAAVSVPSNIAEGHGRRSKHDYVRFLDIARASASEVETQIILAQQLGFASADKTAKLITIADEVQRIVKGLIMKLEGKTPPR